MLVITEDNKKERNMNGVGEKIIFLIEKHKELNEMESEILSQLRK